MVRQRLTNRWSERPPAARSRLASLKRLHFEPRSLPVAVAQLVLVRPMKCATHGQDATAICTYCGRALCPSCDRVASSQRVACSPACAEGLAKADCAVDSILRRTLETTRRSGYFLIVCGLVLLGAGIYGFIQRPDMRPPNIMAAAAGITLLAFGVWNYASAKRRDPV
jgi:hypothetical protein